MVTLKSLRIGKTVKVSTWEGTVRIGKVEAVYPNIKNGRPGIDYIDAEGHSYWCYLNQVIEIVKKGKAI